MRALLLAWYAWSVVAWAPPRRHLAPLRKPRLLAAADETEVPKNVPEDAPLELTNKILRGMRSFPALVGAGALSWLAPPTLVGTAFFLTGGTDLSREVLNSIEDVVLASLSIVLGTLVSTAVSVLRDRQEKIRCCMLREASLLDTLAQQLVKLFRYDKARLKRVTNVLERYVEDCAEIKFWTPHVVPVTAPARWRVDCLISTPGRGEAQIDPQIYKIRLPRLLRPLGRPAEAVPRDPRRRRGVPGQPDRGAEVRLLSLLLDGCHLPVRSFSF